MVASLGVCPRCFVGHSGDAHNTDDSSSRWCHITDCCHVSIGMYTRTCLNWCFVCCVCVCVFLLVLTLELCSFGTLEWNSILGMDFSTSSCQFWPVVSSCSRLLSSSIIFDLVTLIHCIGFKSVPQSRILNRTMDTTQKLRPHFHTVELYLTIIASVCE